MRHLLAVAMSAVLCACAGSHTPAASSTTAPRPWLPVIVEHRGSAEEPPIALLQRLGIALERVGEDLMYSERVATSFEHNYSTPPAPLASDEDLDALQERVQAGLRSTGERSAAEQAVSEFTDAHGDGPFATLDAARRSRALAQRLFDFCLQSAAYALTDASDDRAKAIAETVHCVTESPTLQPDPDLTSPKVLQVYRQAKRHLDERGKRKLRVDVVGQQPEACQVLINGLPEGHPPLEVMNLPQGVTRVAVDCEDRRGRTHLFVSDDKTLAVDPRFEQALYTSSPTDHSRYLGLRYDTARLAERWQLRDGLSLAAALHASELLLVSPQSGKLALRRVDTRSGQTVAKVELDRQPSTAELVAAAEALASGLSGRITTTVNHP